MNYTPLNRWQAFTTSLHEWIDSINEMIKQGRQLIYYAGPIGWLIILLSLVGVVYLTVNPEIPQKNTHITTDMGKKEENIPTKDCTERKVIIQLPEKQCPRDRDLLPLPLQ